MSRAFLRLPPEASISRKPPSGSVAASDSLPPLHVDQLQAAAAEIAGKAVGRMNAGHDAERGKLGLPACPTAR